MSALSRRTSTELVATRTAPRPSRTARWRHRHRHASVPAVVTSASLAAGGVARAEHVAVGWVLAGAVIAVVAVDVWSSRRTLTGRDRKDLLTGSVCAAAVAVGSATGAVGVRTLAVIAGLVVVATARIWRHPYFVRRLFLEDLAAVFPAVADSAREPQLTLAGPIVDRAPDGYTIPVRGPRGHVLTHLPHAGAAFASALGLERGTVQIEPHQRYDWLAFIHVTEGDPHSDPSVDQLDPDVESIADPFLIALYDDGTPFDLQIFDREIGAFDLLIGGDKGSGKSSMLVRILRILVKLPDVCLWGADGAHGRDLGPWAKCFYRYTTDPREAFAQARALRAIVDERERVMRVKGWRVWQPSADYPVIVWVIEESKQFAGSDYGPDFADHVQNITTRNRATGVVVIIITQYAHQRNTFGVAVRKGIPNRFCFRTNEPDTFVLDGLRDTSAIPRSASGSFFAETYGQDRTLRGRIIWTPDEERFAVIDQWQGRQSPVDKESASAERKSGWSGNPDDRGQEELQVSEDGVIDGARYTVREARFEPVFDAPAKRPPMSVDEGRELFHKALEAAGSAGVTSRRLEEMTGWKRTKVREMLLVPMLDGGTLTFQQRGRDRVYVLSREYQPA